MRTKTLLLTAALSAAGVATSMAQVYSVNMVGYINQPIPQGFSMVANHLNNSPDNRVTSLFATPAEGLTVFKYNPATDLFTNVRFLDGSWEGDVNMTLGPGEGGFINAPAAFTHTFVGEVATGTSTVTVQPQFNIISSTLPQSLPLASGLGFPIEEGDQVYRYNPQTRLYSGSRFLDGAWEPAEPSPAVGESFWLRSANAAAKNWTRTFSVSGQ